MLRIGTFGGMSVQVKGEPVKGFASRKAEALLVYLACNLRAFSRELLADMLWDDRPQNRAMSNLRVVLSSLRRQVGPYVAITRETASINPNADLWLDAAELERVLASLPAPTEPIPAGLAAQAAEVLALYQGDFLEGFHLRGARGFEEWQTVERERLRLLVLAALRRLVAHHLRSTSYHEGIPLARQLLRLDPLDEAVHRQLMTLLAYDDQRAAALAQYETCRQVLAEELGIEPSTETAELTSSIRLGELGTIIRPPVTSKDPPTYNLPTPPSPLVGRDEEKNDLTILLLDEAVRLVTIVGPGGIGKSHLALQIALQLSDQFKDGAALVNLAPIRSSGSIIPTIAQSLHFTFRHGPEASLDEEQQLLNHLRRKHLLLVMDNYEHVLDGAPLMTEILHAAPGVMILATSRERLKLQVEQIYPIRGLVFTQWQTVIEAEEYPVVQLFQQNARRVRPGFRLRPEHLEPLWRTCELLQGMPLGVILAAAWLELLSLAEIAEEIRNNLDFLESTFRDIPVRQRSMRAIFETTWKQLTKREQTLFAAISIFRGGFTLAAAREVTAASLPELMKLVDKSLLVRSGSGRFEVHELLRQFAAERLAASANAEATVRDRHAVYYLRSMVECEVALKGEEAEIALAKIETDIENLYFAWNWAVELSDFTYLRSAAFSLAQFCLRSGRYREGLESFGQAVKRIAVWDNGPDAADPTIVTRSPIDDLQILVHLLAWKADIHYVVGEIKAAEQLCLRALSLLERPEFRGEDTRLEKALCLLILGRIYIWLARPERSDVLEKSLSLYRELGDRFGMAVTINRLADIDLRSGSYDEAIQLYSKALRLFRALGHRQSIAYTRFWIGYTLTWQGQLEEGEHLIRQSLTTSQEIGDQEVIGLASDGLGTVALFRGDFKRACTLLSQSVELHEAYGLKDRLAYSLSYGSWAAMHAGDYDQARNWLEESTEIFQANENVLGLGICHFVDGSIWLAQDKGAKALLLLEHSADLLREIRQQDELSQTLAIVSIALLRNGDVAGVSSRLIEALNLAGKVLGLATIVHVLSAAAVYLAYMGENVRAVELYALARCNPFVANSWWFEDVVGQYITAVAAELSPAVAEAARDRGQAFKMREEVARLVGELT